MIDTFFDAKLPDTLRPVFDRLAARLYAFPMVEAVSVLCNGMGTDTCTGAESEIVIAISKTSPANVLVLYSTIERLTTFMQRPDDQIDADVQAIIRTLDAL